MSEPITYVGIDAHKAQLQVAVLAPDAAEPTIWTVRNEVRAVNRLRRRLEKDAPGPIACCYEAGPCGYALQRQLERAASFAIIGGGTAAAQDGRPIDLAAGFGIGNGLGFEDCDDSAGGLSFELEDCSMRERRLSMEVAGHMSDRLAIFGGLHRGSAGLDTTVTISSGLQTVSVPIEVSGSSLGFMGGVRFYGAPLDAGVRGFGSVAGGMLSVSADVSVLTETEGVSSSGFLLQPAGGVDIGLSNRAWIRIMAAFDMVFTEGGEGRGITVTACAVFRLN